MDKIAEGFALVEIARPEIAPMTKPLLLQMSMPAPASMPAINP